MPIAEITRAETGERARLLRVDSYEVALDLTRGAEIFGSTSVIRFGCRRPGAATYVDLIAERVDEITLNGRAKLFRSRVTDALHELRAMVVLHEMAHMWFGNLVTTKWWDDLWLNESFAEFCGTLASPEATRFTDAWTTFSSGRKAWGYMQDRLPSTHPIAADVPTLSQAVANFDGISYAKGASVLRQLVAYVGRPAFMAGIRAYLTEHAWGNATLADLLAALEASSGVSWLTGRRRGWRPPGRTRCAATSASTPAGRSPRSRCCRRRRRSTPRCGRITSRWACTTASTARSGGCTGRRSTSRARAPGFRSSRASGSPT